MNTQTEILASAVAFAIWGAALVGAYKILEVWWRTKPGEWLLKNLPFNLGYGREESIKGVAVIALIIVAMCLFAVVMVFLHDELGLF